MKREVGFNDKLLAARKWRQFLSEVPEDRIQFDLYFDNLGQMRSFRTIAYELNAECELPRIFSLKLNRREHIITVTVKDREKEL